MMFEKLKELIDWYGLRKIQDVIIARQSSVIAAGQDLIDELTIQVEKQREQLESYRRTFASFDRQFELLNKQADLLGKLWALYKEECDGSE